ncbi:hypothetical protein [Planotetraspora kaengkrachanensis]|uniref:Type II toxin-antitoxin system HicB family antitoxin n=1 Tax=Planotetraspora kaengkrachanensis TaxID=575193 RepID=A0A8J3PYT3_9ACTN|nr:hypothetical protein [Planotetraspora kaengkrachanensis]GIG83358.1 hypothetical protein Pka01_64850 [Planotetraspora kaengkrachanensis]
MELTEYLAIPYVIDVTATHGPDGAWVCTLDYEELPGCTASARSPLDALDALDQRRIAWITRRFENGEPIPVPRRPLT